MTSELMTNIKMRSRKFVVWMQQSSERFAMVIVVGVTSLICLALFILPSSHSGGEEHEDEHGSHEEGGEEDHELAVEMADDVLASAGLTLEKAQSMDLQPHVSSRGQITENGNRSMNVKPRFSGLVKSVYKDFGDRVRKGDTLMLIESSATRSAYSIRTAIDGIVADKRVVAGAFIPENESVFRIVDLSSVWFQARLPVRDAEKLKVGLSVEVNDRLLKVSGRGKILYVSPVVDEDTQACDVRIELENSAGDWRIGSFAEAKIYLDSIKVNIAVKSAAIQNLNDQIVVFKRHEGHLVATPVTIGWADDQWSEILTGLSAGDTYVATNSFIAKAELLKSTAEHEH